MPAQRRHALSRLSVPELDGLVEASTCYVLAVWAVGDGPDTAVSDEMSQHTKKLRQGKKIRFFFLISPISVEAHFPVFVFQIFTVLSQLPLANEAPSALQATERTLRL